MLYSLILLVHRPVTSSGGSDVRALLALPDDVGFLRGRDLVGLHCCDARRCMSVQTFVAIAL